jgi:TPR repeat protein
MYGDIASARLFLKRAANARDAQAALDLGMTFDSIFLAQRGVLGVAPDATQAREWYDRAIKLGSTEASRYLEKLASTPIDGRGR